MLNDLKSESNKTFTENGAVTPCTTCSDCLDLFATIGAMRHRTEASIEQNFLRAFAEDPTTALRILFFARDIREGLGERKTFRTVIRWLARNEPASLLKNLEFIAEFGRWDDYLVLLDTDLRRNVSELLHRQFLKDLDALKTNGKVSLLGKWLPSANAHSVEAVIYAGMLIRDFGMREADYRKSLSALRAEIKIIENNLRKRDYTFSYETQPSKAMLKYRKAFMRNDKDRYTEFLSKVKTGEAKLNTETLMPYEIVRSCYTAGEDERQSLDTTWNALEDFTNNENAIVVADGSGSMYDAGGLPATVAQSLAIYYAERNKGAFGNHFITFSRKPRIVEIHGHDIVEKVRYCRTFNECSNTNLEAVFKLILDTAVKHNVPQRELPSTLYIITDMEFDSCTLNSSKSNIDIADEMFHEKGYRLPRIVFWNVNSRNIHQPITKDYRGVILVSGCNANLFSLIVNGDVDPYDFMMKTIEVDRYRKISA